PVELDAGMFLATLSRLRLLHPAHAGEALLTEHAFLEGTRGLLDERALAWHRAAALLQLTERLPSAARGDWRERAHALLAEAALRGYTPGSRATFEARAGERHFAVKLYAEDAESEAELYEALAAAGLVGVGPVRVPPLLARDRTLQLLVIGWLDGPTAYKLI